LLEALMRESVAFSRCKVLRIFTMEMVK